MEHPNEQPLATLLRPEKLEHHQVSPEGAAKRLFMEGLVKEVDTRHVDPVQLDSVHLVKNSLQHSPTTSSYPSSAN